MLLHNLKILGAIVGLFGLLLAAFSLLRNLQRARSELAVRLLYDWARDLNWETARALDLAVALHSDGQESKALQDIYNKKPVSIPSQYYNDVMIMLRNGFSVENMPCPPGQGNETFRISREHSTLIRFLWASWLNRLEGVLSAWLQAVANQELMEREFSKYVKSVGPELKALHFLLEGTPAVRAFYKHISEKDDVERRRPLG